MTKLEGLIFDVDGTIADTERDGHRVAFNRAFAEAGLDWEWSVEFYRQLLAISGGKERIRFYIEKYQPEFLSRNNLNDFIVELQRAKNTHYQQLLKTGSIPLRPGIKRLIGEARDRGVRLAIATTSALPNAIALVKQTLNPEWFEVIAAGDIVPVKKPAPDIYHYILQKMKLTPRNCIVFEDSYHGLQAATDAGLKTIVTVNEYTEGHDFAEAVLVVNHLGEPDLPFTVIKGNIADASYLDLTFLHTLL
ncbi:HAD family hydrolase [Pleurocapsales cyanobacterium LEGE 06147]|nr:HAD family hydrolase [Pleurocapsales cyanobacterium LEGE 06147]